jgi:glycosyltransferase involved in cell wall biosynthesis
MKILIPVDPEIPVPPILYGGVERLVDGLITAYSKMGHEVYLLAHKDSKAKDANKIFFWKGTHSRNKWHAVINSLKLLSVFRMVKPDVIHHFARLLYAYPTMAITRTPLVMTYGRKISPYSTTLASFFGGKKIHFTSAAAHMLNHIKNKSKFTPVYNFTDVDYFVPDNDVEKLHLMFLGRIEDIKGTKECIEVALALNEKLIIAGNIQPGHDEYFNNQIKPHLNNPLIEYIGPVDDEKKTLLLTKS